MGWRRSSTEDVSHHHRNPKKTSGGGGDGQDHESVATPAAAVGLRILIHQYSKCDSNSVSDNCSILLKSKLIKLSTNSSNFQLHPQNPIPSKLINPPLYSYNYSFLKSCFLCHKTLCPYKDVYMYRGDQGFCSEECRNRQIYVDEIREIEISAKKMLAFHGASGGGGGRCEATMLLQERRRRQRQKPLSRTHQPIFSYS